MKILIYSIIIFSNICFASNKIMSGGMTGGGGGTSVRYLGKTVLLDLILLDKKLSFYKKNKSLKLSPFKNAEQILSLWNDIDVSIASEIVRFGIHSVVKWKFVDKRFPLSTRYYIPDGLIVKELKTIAYYLKKDAKFIVEINTAEFNKLDYISQTALIIHEALRHVQIGWDKQNNAFSERNLQEISAIFTLCKPSYTLAMYANYLINDQREKAIIKFGSLMEVVGEYCVSNY